MFEEFSDSYYFGRLYVRPHDGDRAVIRRDQHEQANEYLYADGEGLARTDAPLVVKLDTSHFPVHGEEGVPENTLALPEELLEEVDVSNPPTLREILVAKADRAWQLLRMNGWHAPRGT